MATQFQSVQDMIAAQNFQNQQGQYNLMGGQLGAALQAKQQQAQQQAANQLQNYLALNQQYGGGMAPTPAIQGAANTMFGSPMQQFQGTMGIPSTQGGILPQGPQNIATGGANVNLMKYLQGQGLPQEVAASAAFGTPFARPGQLSYADYQQLNQVIGNIDQYVQQIKTQSQAQGKSLSDDNAKIELYRQLVARFGVNEEPKIHNGLWPMGTTAMLDSQIMDAFRQAQQGGSPVQQPSANQPTQSQQGSVKMSDILKSQAVKTGAMTLQQAAQAVQAKGYQIVDDMGVTQQETFNQGGATAPIPASQGGLGKFLGNVGSGIGQVAGPIGQGITSGAGNMLQNTQNFWGNPFANAPNWPVVGPAVQFWGGQQQQQGS
jgi:hypothetical protein